MRPIILYNNQITNSSGITLNTKKVISDYRTYTSVGANEVSNISLWGSKVNAVGIYGSNLLDANINFGGISVVSKNDNAIMIAGTSDGKINESFNAHNLSISGNSNTQISAIVMGTVLEFPVYPQTPYTPYLETPVIKRNKSKTGHILGADVRYNKVQINATFNYLSRDWVKNQYLPFWEECGKKGKPFFYAWDIDNASEEVFYVSFAANQTHKTPLTISEYVDNLTLSMEGNR